MMASNFVPFLGPSSRCFPQKDGCKQGNSNDRDHRQSLSSAEPYVVCDYARDAFHETVCLLRWTGTINAAYEEVNNISRRGVANCSLAFLMGAIRSFDWNMQLVWLYT